MITRTRKASVFAATFALLTLGVSGAFAAQSTTNLNVRAWPNGRVIDVLSPGEEVSIVSREGGWCEIEHYGPDGWVACRYLTRSQTSYGHNSGADVNFSFGTPGFSISIGSEQDRRPHWQAWDFRRDRDCIRHYGQWYCPAY
jgi:uncharacterized protein YraI